MHYKVFVSFCFSILDVFLMILSLSLCLGLVFRMRKKKKQFPQTIYVFTKKDRAV
jgi:hypothetical protein